MPAFFGLDIGSEWLRIVDIDGKDLTTAAMKNPTGKVGLDVTAAEKLNLAETVKRLIKESGVKKSDVVVSIPEQLVFSRLLELPIMSDPELATAVKWELDQVSPYPVLDMEYSWVAMERPKRVTGEEKMKVLAIAVPKKTAKDYLDFLSVLDLQPVRLENEAFSLVRSLVDSKKLMDKSLIVDIGASSTKMILASSGTINAIHVVSLGGLALTRLLAETFGIAVEQAEQYKLAYGVEQNLAEGKLYKALSPLLSDLVAEIKKVVLGWTGTGGNNKVERLILVGGGAMLKGLIPYLVDQTGLDAVLGNPFEGYQVKTPNVIASNFAGAMGLAIE